MKKFINYKSVTILLFIIIYLFCDIAAPVTGIFFDVYNQYASGGLFPDKSGAANGFVKDFASIKPIDTYNGTANLILRPFSALFEAVDVRIFSLFYFIIIIACFLILLKTINFKKNWQNWLFSSLVVFVFGDFAYLLNLNSPNIEPMFLTAVIALVTISYCQLKKAKLINSIIFALLALFIGGLKTGYFFLAPALTLISLGWLFVRKDKLFIYVNLGLIIAVIALSAAFFGNGVSAELKKIDIVNSVFYGALKDTTYDKALESLKIPADMAEYAGKSYYDIPEDMQIQTTYWDIWKYYLSNPKKYIDKLSISAHNAYEIRPKYISNYANEHKQKYGFTLYSEIKRRFIQPDFWFVLALLLGTIAFCAFNMKKETEKSIKGKYFQLITLCVIAFIAFITPIVIQGEATPDRNLFFYNVIFDITLLNIIIGGTVIAANRREELKSKYGLK